jgi:hypothetical protein
MVNYAQNIFGTDLSEITFDNLINYFAERRLETDTLEFKSFPAQANFDLLISKILKTICGFLNGSGGLLILGAPTKTVIGQVDYFQGALTPLPIQKSVDWFINKISSCISPMPINICVKIIEDTQSFVYLFEIRESQYKPHQVDHIYFIRLDGQTKPAPHFVVQALMRQITYPDLRATLRVNRFNNHAGQMISKLALAIYNFSQLQNEVDYNYALTLVGGAKFLGWNANQFGNQITFTMEGAQLIHKPIPHPLHFGIPHVRSFQITIPRNVSEIQFILSFGGRFSPGKICIYKLCLTDIDVLNPQANITISENNQLFEAKQTIDETLAYFRNNEIV